jgi:hypothetical protein
LDFTEELVGGDGGGRVIGSGEGDEGEWEVAFECVWYANDAAFGDGGVGGDGLLDRTYQISASAKIPWESDLPVLNL